MNPVMYTNHFFAVNHKTCLSLTILLLLILASCTTKSETGCEPDIPCIPETGPHPLLSDYGLFKGELQQLEPIDALLPYDVNTELFSDYAQKRRLIYIPDGKSIVQTAEGDLEFPLGSVLVKTFMYEHNLQDESGERTILETRLLILREEGWSAETYVWNEDQTEATLHQTGDTKTISWNDEEGVQRNVSYRIPSVNDCSNCHGGNGDISTLGPTIRNLNKTYFYDDGESNQITKWQQNGFLQVDKDPSTMPQLPVWDDPASASLNLRTRAYLDVNCANCHHPSGSASNSALFLEFEQTDPFHLGVCKTAVAAGTGSGGLRYNIVPGKPEKSILFYRMNSTEPAIRMPEIGRTLIHEEAVELIGEWIKNLNLPPCDE